MGPPAPPPPQIVYQSAPQQPTREDPAIDEARKDELRRQQAQRGRASTLLVARPNSNEALLPAMAGNGASMLGAG